MNPVGALLGGLAGAALWLVLSRVSVLASKDPRPRVAPYVRDLAHYADLPFQADRSTTWGSLLSAVVRAISATTGGPESVRRRLRRAGLATSVGEFRAQQIVWGLVAFVAAAVLGTARAIAAPEAVAPMLLLTLIAGVGGVVARDLQLTSQAKSRERQMLEEFPAVAELLALAVAAGEGPVPALARVVQRTRGALSRELEGVLARIRTGVPVAVAFDELAAATGLSVVARFAQGIAVAVERGTPLADVLHAQAADVREATRRELIEVAARKEIAMMVPVVFLVLPITVVFALWPGVLGLNLSGI